MKYFIPTRMATIKKTSGVKQGWLGFLFDFIFYFTFWQGTRNLIHWWCECKMTYPLWKMAWQFPKLLNVYKVTIWPSNSTPNTIYPQEKENVCSYNGIIHNTPKGETTQMSTNQWVDKKMWYIPTQWNIC